MLKYFTLLFCVQTGEKAGSRVHSTHRMVGPGKDLALLLAVLVQLLPVSALTRNVIGPNVADNMSRRVHTTSHVQIPLALSHSEMLTPLNDRDRLRVFSHLHFQLGMTSFL